MRYKYVNGLTLDNVIIETERADVREDFVFEKAENLSLIQ